MKPVVAIFAHPDDEAFGPAGTLALLAKKRKVYLICVTDGAAGINSSNKTKALSEIRKEELLASAELLGITKVFFLDYSDGSLSNSLYHEIADKIQNILDDIKPDTLITYELRGMSGHLDHIAVSFITTYVFERSTYLESLWYYCITQERRAHLKDYFIYFPEGYHESSISKSIDVAQTWDKKITAMYAHASQAHDIERGLSLYRQLPKKEHFIVRNKSSV